MAKRSWASTRRTKNAAKGKGRKKKPANIIRNRPPEKHEMPIKGSNAIPEIFDSDRANAMTEMKESASMDQRDLTKVLSHVQRQEPVQPESVTTKPTAAEATNIGLPALNPTVEERASVVKESEQAIRGRMNEDETLV